MTDWLESQYHRDTARPLVLSQHKFQIGQLLRDSDGDVVQIIGLEWCLTEIGREPYWKYAIWDISLGAVLDSPELLLSTYTLIKS